MGLINRNRAQPLKNITFSHIMDICTSPTSVKTKNKKKKLKNNTAREMKEYTAFVVLYIFYSHCHLRY